MAALFADLPEALENTVEIARRCAFKADTRDPIILPASNPIHIAFDEKRSTRNECRFL